MVCTQQQQKSSKNLTPHDVCFATLMTLKSATALNKMQTNPSHLLSRSIISRQISCTVVLYSMYFSKKKKKIEFDFRMLYLQMLYLWMFTFGCFTQSHTFSMREKVAIFASHCAFYIQNSVGLILLLNLGIFSRVSFSFHFLPLFGNI